MRVGSICSGAGIHLHGWSVPVWAIECDREIAQCYKNNHGDNVIIDYVQNVNFEDLKSVDCIVATPSCKNASKANNKSRETIQDFEVATSIAGAIKHQLPQFFILENVTQYAQFTSFDVILSQLQQSGYFWKILRLNLADFGIAQSRKRLYLIASRLPLPLFIFPQQQKIGWYETIKDLMPGLPISAITNYQQKLIDKWESTPQPPYAFKRVGLNKNNFRPLLPHEPMFTWRALGRSCDRHWQQMNLIDANNQVRVITPAAALRFFGDKETADKIKLPQNNAIASECVGNGASWTIFKCLIKIMTSS